MEFGVAQYGFLGVTGSSLNSLLSEELGILSEEGVSLRATLITNPDNVIQHISVNALDTGRNPQEALRILKALQAGGLTACNWSPGQELLG